MPIAMPQTCITIGAIGMTNRIKVLKVGKVPYRVPSVYVAIGSELVTNDASNHWVFNVETIDLDGNVLVQGGISKSHQLGMKVDRWEQLDWPLRMIQEATLTVKVERVGSPTGLSGFEIAYDLETRYDRAGG